ncbi:bis(5'-nucleosyl)-tetraphosphatase (symmetrical) YqeK [Clostridium vincentii]|uniref:bis(5'-nucleosyl)-tetraphosphatase (symmetrical) n=1 Tax=Clostridium vincentii TaxID=52704 RepID=A0A2T0BEX6_9CLOT|nr:bis(5'-nucleosyl)-tetraphosphatase (symmetrical) YqeK [Clostridium vincentii]PRR82392.1 putative nicotinate-nucleotide adenylyltransferase [Clostridium vincentii]
MSILQEAYKYVKVVLNEDRFIHTLGVVSVAKKLAIINGVSEEKAEIAALCHDIAKNTTQDEMNMLIIKNNVILSEDEKNTLQLWHGIVGPYVAKNVLNIEDEDILGAIRWHTTGKEKMTKLEKIIYISDMIEPARIFEGIKKLREVTLNDLDEGVLLGLTQTINFLLLRGDPIDLNTIKARNYLLINRVE